MRWLDKYIGLPFVDGGRDFQGVDCWGLVRLVLKTEKGIDVPSYGEISAKQLMQVAEMVEGKAAIDPWIPVSNAECFDVAVMHRRRAPVHVGIMISQTHILHVEEKISAVIVSLQHQSVAFRDIKLYRHKELVDEALRCA